MTTTASHRATGAGDLHANRQQWLSLAGLLLLVTLWRFYQIRGLALPAWVDSVHHTLLVRILLEQGWVPTTWAPYLPETPFYYHFGFHASAALFAALTDLTGTALGTAVLIVGQLWQVLLVLAVYLLARTLFAQPESAFVAALLVGFVAEMPAFYVTWGRYTLLAGVTLLILAMAAANAKRWIALILVTALTALTHFYAFFLLALYLLLCMAFRLNQRRPLLLSSLVAALLVSPWLWRVWQAGRQWAGVGTNLDDERNSLGYLLTLLGPWHNYLLLLVGVVGLGWMVRQSIHRANGDSTPPQPSPAWGGSRDLSAERSVFPPLWGRLGGGKIPTLERPQPSPPAGSESSFSPSLISGKGLGDGVERVSQQQWLPFVIWTLCLIGLLGPLAIQPFRADHAALIVFLPAVLFGAVALEHVPSLNYRWMVVMLLLAWGMVATRNIIRPDTVFATAADRAAIDWITDNTPADATFAIDVEPWFGLWRGADGGWWITPLTGRRTVLPPIVYAWSDPAIRRQYTDAAAQLADVYRQPQATFCPTLASYLQSNNASHYYTRSPRPQPCPQFTPVYQGSGDVWIFQFDAFNQ